MRRGCGQGDIAGREHVVAAKREQQIDLCRPPAQAAHRGNRGDRRLVVHGGDRDGIKRSVEECRSEHAGVDDLRTRQSGGTKHLVGQGQQARRFQRTSDGAQPPPDRGGRLVADLLRDDRLQQAGKSRRAGAPGQRAGTPLDAGQVGIAGDQPIERGAGGGGRMGERHARRSTQSAAAGHPPAMRVHREPCDHRAVRCGKREPDRSVRRRRHIHHLPAVIAVPQQEALGDLLHIGRGELAILRR